jgi:hypothetical protein
MDTRSDVVSIRNYTRDQVVYQAEFVWIVSITQPDVIVILARKDFIVIQANQSPTKKLADVS